MFIFYIATRPKAIQKQSQNVFWYRHILVSVRRVPTKWALRRTWWPIIIIIMSSEQTAIGSYVPTWQWEPSWAANQMVPICMSQNDRCQKGCSHTRRKWQSGWPAVLKFSVSPARRGPQRRRACAQRFGPKINLPIKKTKEANPALSAGTVYDPE